MFFNVSLEKKILDGGQQWQGVKWWISCCVFPTRPANYCATKGSERRLCGLLRVWRHASGSVGLAKQSHVTLFCHYIQIDSVIKAELFHMPTTLHSS